MKTRLTQFGVRENTASSRQHAPRLAMSGSLQLLDPLHSTESTERSAQELKLSTKETFRLSLEDPAKGTAEEGENATTATSNPRRNPDSPGVSTSRLTVDSSSATVQRISAPANRDGASSSLVGGVELHRAVPQPRLCD